MFPGESIWGWRANYWPRVLGFGVFLIPYSRNLPLEPGVQRRDHTQVRGLQTFPCYVSEDVAFSWELFSVFLPFRMLEQKYFKEEIKCSRMFPSVMRLSTHGVSGAHSQSLLVAALISLTWDSISLKSI